MHIDHTFLKYIIGIFDIPTKKQSSEKAIDLIGLPLYTNKSLNPGGKSN